MGPIAILGAGSLGQLWAGYLPAGRAVFLRRNPSAPALHEYRLKHPEGPETFCTVPVLAVADCCPELLLVTTKAGDTLTALSQTLPDLPHSVPIVLFQNGLGCQQAVAECWPGRPVLAATTTEGANRPEPGQLVHAGRGRTWVGGLTDTGKRSVADVLAGLCASGLIVVPEPDIHQRLWEKLVVNAGINAFTALLDCPNGDILAHRFFLDHIQALSAEIAWVMATETSHPLSAKAIRTRIEDVAISTAGNTSSMRSDCQRGRKTEIDVINGYIVEKGQAAGIATPVNQMLTQRVKELT